MPPAAGTLGNSLRAVMESRLRCSLGFLGFGSEAWAAAFLRRLGPGVPGVVVDVVVEAG